MPFLPPNRQRQSTEGNQRTYCSIIVQSIIATKTPLFSDWQFGTKDNEIFTLEI